MPQIKHRKRGPLAFEQTHERITLWIDSELKRRFEALAIEQGMAKSTLLDEALTAYLEGAVTSTQARKMKGEVESLARRLTVEERLREEVLDHEKRMRLDTEVHHFKKWLRSHDQPRDSDFFKWFLADGQLPEHASRGMYEAKMKVACYSQEDVYLFQDGTDRPLEQFAILRVVSQRR